MFRRGLLLSALFAASAVTGGASAGQSSSAGARDYLFVWAADEDGAQDDFLAVVDAGSGEVVTTVAAGARGTRAHHTEHEMPEGGTLLANGFAAGKTFMFDLRNPLRPRLGGTVADADPLRHAHSFARLSNGKVLATYQTGDHDNRTPGGLAEIAPDGRIVRRAPTTAAGTFVRPYSLAVVPKLDRLVSTSSDMHSAGIATTVQVWRLSDLKLLHTIPLPPGPRGKEHEDSAEPRLLADSETVLVNTFNCGLYKLDGLASDSPSARLVHDFGDGICALPVVSGRYWVQTDSALPGLVALDISSPDAPTVADRLVLKPGEEPHWIALAADGRRIVLSSGGNKLKSRVMLATLDPGTGKLSLVPDFDVDFDRESWPHGKSGKAIPHGAVFSRP